jgi:hypothetical protein
MNDLNFAGRYQCLQIRRSGRLISLHNEYSIQGVPGGVCQTSGGCSLC